MSDDSFSTPTSLRLPLIIPTETPHKTNEASTNALASKEKLEKKRSSVIKDLGSQVPVVTVDYMLQHIVPVSGIDMAKTTRNVKECLRYTDDDQGWKAYQGLTPKEYSEAHGLNEDGVFKVLTDIYKNIIDKTQFINNDRKSVTLNFEQHPSLAPQGNEEVKEKTRPDGVGKLAMLDKRHTKSWFTVDDQHRKSFDKFIKQKDDGPGYYSWYDIPYIEEFKIHDGITQLNDNIAKVVWHLHHIMRFDYRRRFVYALSIENEITRIWYCCRQSVIVSEPFNFNKEGYHYLVHLISSLAYAHPSQLGYDVTMALKFVPASVTSVWQYDIQVGTRTYKTISLILDTSLTIRGRATRVWKAVCKDSQRICIIKDCWYDINRQKEGDILSNLLYGASDDIKKLFLTVIDHGVVQSNGRDDCTRNYFRGGPTAFEENVAQTSMFPLTHSEAQTQVVATSVYGTLTHHSSQPDAQAHVEHSHKLHYRIVFSEVGTSLLAMAESGAATIGTLGFVLPHITAALEFMARQGYVHRDVSATNIIIVGSSAKLGDLEYAKRYRSPASSPVRTVNYDFMAGEVMTKRYKYTSLAEFVHNPLHDLESLWWVAIWFVISHYPVRNMRDTVSSGVNTLKDNIQALHNARKNIFPGKKVSENGAVDYAQNRLDQLHSDTIFVNSAGFLPTEVSAILSLLNRLRQAISVSHRIAQEYGLPSENTSYFTDVLSPYPWDPTQTRRRYHDISIYAFFFRQISRVSFPDNLAQWPLDALLKFLNNTD